MSGNKILLQTSIPYIEDDWHIGRYSLLHQYLSEIKDENGAFIYDVVSRDREPDETGVDRQLAEIDISDIDQIWLMAADAGNGLSSDECLALSRFQRKGGSIVFARDHQDLGACICNVDRIGSINFFHSSNLDPSESNRYRDDDTSPEIDFPNYHSGRNGDFQEIFHCEPFHPLFIKDDGSLVKHFPSHPHEGGIGISNESDAERVVAQGKSLISGRSFNLVVALDNVIDNDEQGYGKAVVHSSFHHFLDYNWIPDHGCPSFLTETPGDGFAKDPAKLDDFKSYVKNLATWLGK